MSDRPTSCNADEEVVFIYGDDNFSPSHAAVKRVSGPWSDNRTGLCGVSPDHAGPMPYITRPCDRFCASCKEHVEKRDDGKWHVKRVLQTPDPSRQIKTFRISGFEEEPAVFEDCD